MKATVGALTARAYIRVSHIGKSRQDTLLSDQMQMDEARRYAEFVGLQFDEESSKRYADLDVSGFRKPWRQRPGLMEHYRAAQKGEFQVLIFYKISRLARNVREALDMINEFEKLGVAFHFVAERIDSTSAQGRFLRNVLLSAAEMQSEDTSAFLKSACERRAREGRVMGALPAWIARTSEGELAAIPDQILAFKRMVELRIEGLGYVRIAQRLNQEGHRTANGRHWTDGTTYKYLQPDWIMTMLGSGFYGRKTTEEVEIPNAYPPILTQAEADKLLALQKVYSLDYARKPVSGLDWQVSRRRKNGRYSADSIHLLSSIIFCPYCGARMIATLRTDATQRATPFTYRCPHYRTLADEHKQGLSSIAASQVEDAVLRVIRIALHMPPKGPESPKRQMTDLTKVLEALQVKIDRLVNMHLDGKISRQDYQRLYAELLTERQDLMERQANDHSEAEQRQAAHLLGKDQLTREELRQLVLLMVKRVEAPLVEAGWTVRRDLNTLRRFARVTLKFPTSDGHQVFRSGLYKQNYSKGKQCMAERTDGAPDIYSSLGNAASVEKIELARNNNLAEWNPRFATEVS